MSENWLDWDLFVLFHPMSHLIGISIETAAKGLIACRTAQVPRTHDLVSLLGDVTDAELGAALDAALEDLSVPSEILDVFEPEDERNRACETKDYRHYLRHVESLNQIYAFPYATRYPALGVHPLPDPEALRRIVKVMHVRLDLEMQVGAQSLRVSDVASAPPTSDCLSMAWRPFRSRRG